jgi:Icc-related predicted phosphoesterase
MKFVAVGDFTCKNQAEKTMDNIKKRTPDIVLALGDFSYQKKEDFEDGEEPLDCFLKDIDERIPELKSKIKPLLGNHEDDEEIGNHGDKMKEAIKREFGIQSFHYSFDFGNVHFLILNSQAGDYEEAPAPSQHAFVREDLKAACANSATDWIIVCYHKPTITSSTDHEPEVLFRDIYHELFDEFKVDLILTGHNHNYQRSNVIIHDPQNPPKPIVIDSGNGPYDTRQGRIHMVLGTGGRKFDEFTKPKEEDQEKFIKKRMKKHGILCVELLDRKQMNLKFFGNDSDDQDPPLDEFIIDKSG